MRRRVLLVVAAIAIAVVSLWLVDPFGRLLGQSGSWLPYAAWNLTDQERRTQTETRAREILRAVLAFEATRGRLPAALDELKAELPTIPTPLTSTLPFRYEAENATDFIIAWEAFPDAMYERYWLDRSGRLQSDL